MRPFHTSYSILVWLWLAAALLVAGCDTTEPEEDAGESELITRVVLSLTGPEGTNLATASDPDGDGSGFNIEPITLQSGANYAVSVRLFDDVSGEEITGEVEEEGEEHQFFYTPGGDAGERLTVTVIDSDENGLPVGLSFTLSVAGSAAGTATLNVVLSHFDDSPKNGVDRSDETDVDVTFPVVIEAATPA